MKCAEKVLVRGDWIAVHFFHRAQAQIRPARQLNGQRDSAKTTWLRCSAKAPSTSSSTAPTARSATSGNCVGNAGRSLRAATRATARPDAAPIAALREMPAPVTAGAGRRLERKTGSSAVCPLRMASPSRPHAGHTESVHTRLCRYDVVRASLAMAIAPANAIVCRPGHATPPSLPAGSASGDDHCTLSANWTFLGLFAGVELFAHSPLSSTCAALSPFASLPRFFPRLPPLPRPLPRPRDSRGGGSGFLRRIPVISSDTSKESERLQASQITAPSAVHSLIRLQERMLAIGTRPSGWR